MTVPELLDDRRAPRRIGPVPPRTVPRLPPPPAAVDATAQNSVMQPVMTTVGMLGCLIFFVINPSPLFIVAGVLFAGASIASGISMAVSARRRSSRQLSQTRERYLDRLAEVALHSEQAVRHERTVRAGVHPPPDALAGLAAGSRLFERRRGDRDFLELRVGTGTILGTGTGTGTDAARPATTERPADPVCALLAAELLDTHAALHGVPVGIGLRDLRVVMFGGTRAPGAVRAMLAQLAVWHRPADVQLVVAAADPCEWAWTRWLPHLQGGAVLTDVPALDEALTPLVLARAPSEDRFAPSRPHVVVVADGVLPEPGGALGLLAQDGYADVTVVVVARDGTAPRPRWVDAYVQVDSPAASVPGSAVVESFDTASPRLCEAIARAVARGHDVPAGKAPHGTTPGEALAGHTDLPGLLGVPDLAGATPADREWLWRTRPYSEMLRAPIGRTEAGTTVWLDLKEAGAGGVGPHGLVVGATGSGKSELLRTLVLGLAMQHPPEQLSFVLADFKGGAAFAGLAALPHTAGVITNLSDDSAAVERVYQALFGEQQRRQELLRAAGNLSSLVDYHAAAAEHPELPPLPHLLVVVDEFSELLSARPDFADLFASIGRLGRSLGIHLLLASQRLDEGRLRGLESHISYRIALRTFSAVDSSAVIGVPDAYRLPDEPGWAYLKAGTSLFQRLRTVSCSEPIDVAGADALDAARRRRVSVVQVTSTLDGAPFALPSAIGDATMAADPTADVDAPTPTVCEAGLALLADDARRTHQVWLPPLTGRLDLGGLLTGITETAQLGMHAAQWPGLGRLIVPVGIVDLPRQQRYEVGMLDLTGDRGGVLVLGAPQTGKTTLLKTLALSLAATHTPDQVQLYVLDLGGGLVELDELPHVGAVVGRTDPERVARTVSTVQAMLDDRAAHFAEHGVTSMAQARERRDDPHDEFGRCADVFLFVDAMLDLRTQFPDLEAAITDLATRGLSYGVHVVLAAGRSADCRPAVRDVLGSRIELRLGEPADSVIDRAAARDLPRIAGRALVDVGTYAQLALPALLTTSDGRVATVRETAHRIAAAWPGAVAGQVRNLPDHVGFAELPQPGSDPLPGVPVGVDADLTVAYLDITGHDPNLVVVGDAESGKTGVLQVVLAGLTERITPDQAQVYVVDYRRGLLEQVPEPFLAGYAASAPAAVEIMDRLLTTLQERLPGADLTAAELRSRSWWSGPELFLVVDDYDLVDSALGNPLSPIAEFLPLCRDIGLHVLLARRCSGISRAMFSPLLARLKDFGCSGVVLSGDPTEGAVFGDVRATPQPTGRGVLVRGRSEGLRVQFAAPAPRPDLDTDLDTDLDAAPTERRDLSNPTRSGRSR